MNADELVRIETFPATLRHEAETLILQQPYRSRLFADNPLYWQKQKDRIRNYWHCYHSRRYPDWQSYPVRLLAEEINKEIARIVFRRPPTTNVV